MVVRFYWWSPAGSVHLAVVGCVASLMLMSCRQTEPNESASPNAGGTRGSPEDARGGESTRTNGGARSGVDSAGSTTGSPSSGGARSSAGGGRSNSDLAGATTSGRSSTGGAANGGSFGTRRDTTAGEPSTAAGGRTEVGSTTAGATNSAGARANCRALWRFESLVDGKISDLSGHDQSLVVNRAALADGPRGAYLSLTGTNSSAVADGPIINATASFSLSAWVKFDQLGSFNTIVSQDGRAISAFYLQKRNSGRLAFTTYAEDSVDASACITEGAIQPRAGEWYHLAATRNASTLEQRLYVDGVLSGSSKCPGGFTTTAPLVVGRGRWDGEVDWTSGGVDELCVSDRVMTPEEIVDLYAEGRPTGKNYLFAYFAEQAQGRGDGLRLAQSHDALYWGAVGGGKVFLPPSVGGKSFRDPHVMRDPGGVYHVVWTTSCVPWAESGCVQDKGFGHAQSTDLVHFGEPSYVPIDLNVEHVWAPETFYDRASGQYMVFWSSPLDNNPSAADPHSIYYVLTKDFVTFTKPAVLYARNGRNFIDATILEQSGGYLMFLKDEADGQKNIRVVSSTTLYGTGAWGTDPSAPLTGNYGAEGPSALVDDSRIYVFFDKYNDGQYGALLSTGLTNLSASASWQDISSTVFFAGVRHGTPIEVPLDVYRAVALKAGE